ncbi:hypothetical protein [Ligilactobacillus murinus]|uniref:hypothetical protein n=1 Tax=Ligilactobacillus murinus TaxID=1622 RepID=UPI0012982D5B|nr:hypothetical protein [Ligilactobacillus murinus]WRY38405.1 hypothetical protein P8F80_03730 [Ligilactobacillus murinus]
MKTTFRRYLYRYTRFLNYTKNENTLVIMINGFLLLGLYVGFSNYTMPSSIIPYRFHDKLLMFYGITLILLVNSRVLWRWYHKFRFAGIVEVISNYVNAVVIVILLGWITEIDHRTLAICVSIVLVYNIILLTLVAMGYKETPKYMLYAVVILSIIATTLYFITGQDIFIKFSFIPVGCILSLRVILYWLMLDTPYRRNLIKEFGPKDIDKSAIFVSKKKSK